MENKKTVELYLDPQTYTEEQMMESIQKAVKEFSKKDVRVNININEWGVYVVTLEYIDKQNYINRIKNRIRLNKKQKMLKKYTEQVIQKIYEPSNQIISIPQDVK